MTDKHTNPHYQSAIARNIQHNARVGRARRNLQEMPLEVRALADVLDADSIASNERSVKETSNEERAREGIESIEYYIENFIPKWSRDERGQVEAALSIIDNDWGNFGEKLVAAWIVFGKLSDKQMEWVVTLPTKMAERKQARADELEARQRSEWVGELKERLRGLNLTVTYTTVVTSQFGDSKLVKFVDADGNEFGWFGSGLDAWQLDKGDDVVLTGTVKEHSTYEGIKQTMLTRCKIGGAK